jgi:hypothetical protein
VSQQILQPVGGNQSFIPKGLYLIGIMVHPLIFYVTRGSVVLIAIIIVNVVLIVVVMALVVVVIIVVDVVGIVIVVIVIVIVLIIPWQLLLPGFPVPQVPWSQSQRAPPHEEHTAKSHIVPHVEAAHSLVPIIQLACVQCSCGLCSEDKPSKIWK